MKLIVIFLTLLMAPVCLADTSADRTDAAVNELLQVQSELNQKWQEWADANNDWERSDLEQEITQLSYLQWQLKQNYGVGGGGAYLYIRNYGVGGGGAYIESMSGPGPVGGGGAYLRKASTSGGTGGGGAYLENRSGPAGGGGAYLENRSGPIGGGGAYIKM